MAEPQCPPKDNYVLPKERKEALIDMPEPNPQKAKAIRRYVKRENSSENLMKAAGLSSPG